MYGIDTYSVAILLRLQQTTFPELISDIINRKEFMITHEVHKELIFRFSNNIDFYKAVSILPTINQVFSKYLNQGFDSADASLLEYSELQGIIIITEDQPMLHENIIDESIKVIQLVDYFGLKMIEGIITPSELYQIVKVLRKWRIISKYKEVQILDLRNRLK